MIETRRGLHGSGRYNRSYHRHRNRGSEAEVTDHPAPGKPRKLRWYGDRVLQKLKFFQLVKRQPDQLFVEGRIELDFKPACNLRRRSVPVATAPNQGRSVIKTMGPVAVEIVN